MLLNWTGGAKYQVCVVLPEPYAMTDSMHERVDITYAGSLILFKLICFEMQRIVCCVQFLFD